MPPTAVEHGRPTIIARWWRSYAIAMAGLLIPAATNLLLDLDRSGPLRALLIVAASVQVAAIIWMLVLVARYLRMLQALRARPRPCLHCLYALPPGQPRCPECGRVQNAEELAPRWRERLRPRS